MKFLPDQVVARLQTEMQTPNLSGTRYHALKLLGQGGMGSIWLAEAFCFASHRGAQSIVRWKAAPPIWLLG